MGIGTGAHGRRAAFRLVVLLVGLALAPETAAAQPAAAAPPSAAAPAATPSEGASGGAEPVSSADPVRPPPSPPEVARTEIAGFPGVVANSQVGVVFGVNGSVTRFEPGYAPFRFRLQLVAAASIRGSDTGVSSPLQSIDLRLDLPGLDGRRLRIYSLLRYRRSLRAGYYGIGNGASGTIPDDYTGPRDRFFTFERRMLEARVLARYRLRPGFDFVAGSSLLGIDTVPSQDGKLDRDVTASTTQADPLLRAYSRELLIDALVGLLIDHRDDEFNPRRGGYHEISIRAGGGPSADLPASYGALYLSSRWFFPLVGEKLVLALRGVADVGFGPMPLIQLSSIGGYVSYAGPGGSEANRGLPYGRQLGRVKLIGNVELRSTFARFHVRRQQFGLGAVVFADASRVFASVLPADGGQGGGPPLRVSVGGGLRFLWGRAFVFRIDVGVSPGAGIDGRTSVLGTFTLGHAF